MEKKALKQRILESSLELFQKNGYHGVTVEQIVEKANTSKGGLNSFNNL
ncbi:TetR/AcrR family transcriptional regulator [Caldibacillus thermoamylovorans]|nr:helix-turn-helix domain-containing protein [Caldibacillus thermoamylovorans]MCB5935938.1 TetR/AcrR family transcriptional regulator [Bacillus sp. DFI.2.34]MCB7076945.1 TetR/AcrR family transcriptional regulator [Caldibacillus thermoamylovorans]